jgi:putative ATP-grasp target RiPP
MPVKTPPTPVGFADDPLASPSGQFSLCRPKFDTPAAYSPSPVGVRPWGLRQMAPARAGRVEVPAHRYDPVQQLAVDSDGRPLVSNATAGDPSADTTATVDGEDPPSSEDWENDYWPDHPAQP